MEFNDMMNEEVMETAAEEIVKTGSKTLGKVAGIGLTAVVSVVAYEFVVKPITKNVIAKVKFRKQEKDAVVADEDFEVVKDYFEDK